MNIQLTTHDTLAETSGFNPVGQVCVMHFCLTNDSGHEHRVKILKESPQGFYVRIIEPYENPLDFSFYGRKISDIVDKDEIYFIKTDNISYIQFLTKTNDKLQKRQRQ